ncbi:hypothetical protein [Pseudomonas sp.]|uniref:hypothetical protein n=1 Tax=Pseudomonas sp. TaxID=306 RepID=UPI00272A05D2|nr:hypothetical protein [Pseudomonas sp.]
MDTMRPDPLLPGTDDTIGSLRQSLSAIRLPVENTQRDRLLGFMEADQLSLHELAAELLQVPVAALEICRAAGQAARPRDIDVLTLEQACGLLGTQRVANVLKQLPVAEAEDVSLALRQMLSISEHALFQARGLFSQRMARLWHEMALGTLLFMSPFWALVHHRPELFSRWDRMHLQADDPATNRQLAQGALFLALAQQVAEDWWLPPWIVQGYRSLSSTRRTMVKALHIARDTAHPHEQQARLDSDKQLYRWLTQPANGLLLANGLALGAHHDWEARHTERWQRLTALYLGCRLEEAQASSHQHAVDHAHSAIRKTGEPLWLPAESLLWPTMSRAAQHAAVNSEEPVPESSEASVAAAPAPIDPVAWREHCARLTQTPNPFANIPTILVEALRALTDGLGVKQCWIALYNARESQMIIGASLGTERRLAGRRLGQFRGTPWGDWLLSARSHPLEGSHHGTTLERLPEAVRAVVGSEPGHLLPLVLRGQLGGLLYAEFGTVSHLSPERQTQAAERTLDCLEKALLTFKAGS